MSTFVEHEGEGDLLGLAGKNESKRNGETRHLTFQQSKEFWIQDCWTEESQEKET
jgi:hypothetical protein